MRQMLLSIILFLTSSAVALAAEGRVFQALIERMQAELSLSDEQTQQIIPIVRKNVLQRQAYLDSLQGEAITNNRDFKRVSRKLKKEMNQELEAVLTAAQMQRLIEKQNIRESLNKDLVDFSEGLSGESFNPQGASLAF